MRLAKTPTPGRVLYRMVSELCRKCGNLGHYRGNLNFKRYYCKELIYSRLQRKSCSYNFSNRGRQ